MPRLAGVHQDSRPVLSPPVEVACGGTWGLGQGVSRPQGQTSRGHHPHLQSAAKCPRGKAGAP